MSRARFQGFSAFGFGLAHDLRIQTFQVVDVDGAISAVGDWLRLEREFCLAYAFTNEKVNRYEHAASPTNTNPAAAGAAPAAPHATPSVTRALVAAKAFSPQAPGSVKIYAGPSLVTELLKEQPMAGMMDCFGITDIGRKRTANEDQFLIADLNKSMRVHQTSLGLDHQTRLFGNSQGKLLAVADGMGGHEGGERASQLAVDSVVTYVLNTLNWYFRLNAETDEDFREELKVAIQHCQTILQRDVESSPQRRGMGTTLTMAYVIWPRMYVVHVGDSRCYLLRDGELKQLTRDHTMAQLYKESGYGRRQHEDLDASQLNNMLWNVISADDGDLHPEVHQVKLQLGDAVLLCTDGLTIHVDETQIIQLLSDDGSTQEVCQQLVDAANHQGGNDNITVVISRFQKADEETKVEQTQVKLSLDQEPGCSVPGTTPIGPPATSKP